MSNTTNNIIESFKIGADSEEIVFEWMLQKNWKMTDVRKDKIYQIKDIDYLVRVDNFSTSVDVKSDKRFETGNYFIETFSSVEKNIIGWGFGSQAEYIIVYYPTVCELHLIDMYALKTWLVANAGKYRTITNATRREDGTMYHSQGIVVNRQKLMDEIGTDNLQINKINIKDVA